MAKIVSARAELAVLRGLLSPDKKIAGTLLSSVDETYFHYEESREVFEAIQYHFKDEGTIPKFKLLLEDSSLSKEAVDHIKESEVVIRSMDDANKALKNLNKFRQLRGLYNVADHIATAVKKSKVDVSDLLESVSDAIGAVHSSKINKDSFQHHGMNNNSTSDIKELLYSDSTEHVIPTGIPEFDKDAGGFVRGSLVTLGGSSGGGKSIMGNQLAMNMAAAGYKVLVVPLEMSKSEMNARMVANRSGLDVTRILHHKLATGERELAFNKWQKWVKRVKKKGGRYTIFKPESDMTIEEIMAAVNVYDCDVVLIDYISLLKGVDGDDAWQRLGAAARFAKINAETTNRVNILLCQVSDDGKIRYARSISEHSTNSWIWVTPKAEREKVIGRIKIEQPKARNSRSVPFEVGFHWSAMKVVAAPDSDDDGNSNDHSTLPNLSQPDV